VVIGERRQDAVVRTAGVHNSKLLFPTRSYLLPKGSVFLIDRMPYKLSAFFNLSLEEPIRHSTNSCVRQFRNEAVSPPTMRRPRRFGVVEMSRRAPAPHDETIKS
jgi:hypothetical protein